MTITRREAEALLDDDDSDIRALAESVIELLDREQSVRDIRARLQAGWRPKNKQFEWVWTMPNFSVGGGIASEEPMTDAEMAVFKS